jgi:phosphoglycerate dehydrogenase-like enzyme
LKALLQFSASSRLTRVLQDIKDVQIVVIDEGDHAAYEREIADAEILLHVLQPVTAEMIQAAPRLKLIQKIGVGIDTIDLDAARKAGIAVANMPNTNTTAVAEHTLALMFGTLRRISGLDSMTRTGNGWHLPPDSVEAIGEISGSTVGLVGYGSVARRLAPQLQALGAKVQYWSRSRHQDLASSYVPFDTLLKTSDILSLHIPLTDATRKIFNYDTIGKMKYGAVLINTARGGLVDHAALVDALMRNRLAGAGLDVFEREPFVDTAALAACPNVVLTPHIAWLTPQTFENSLIVILENARRLKESRDLVNRVV